MRGQAMATEMAEALSDSLNFVQALFLWMQTAYVDLVEEQGKSSAESVWKFIMHAVKNIFWELHQVRHFGNGRNDATMAWYALKARALQNELIAENFIDHEIVVRVMHQHLKNNVVPKSIYENDKKEWKEAIERLTKEVQSLKSKRKN